MIDIVLNIPRFKVYCEVYCCLLYCWVCLCEYVFDASRSYVPCLCFEGFKFLSHFCTAFSLRDMVAFAAITFNAFLPRCCRPVCRLIQFPRKYSEEFLLNRFPVPPQPLRDDMTVRIVHRTFLSCGVLGCALVQLLRYCSGRLTRVQFSKDFIAALTG